MPETLDVILNDVGEFVRDYVVVSDEQRDILALWIVHTHCFSSSEYTPYLCITSPVKRSGKSTLLEVLNCLTARPWYTGRVTAAVLVRMIDTEIPTLLLDESDTTFTGKNQYGQALRGVLNTGFRRGGQVSVMQGGAIANFSTYCPKAIAGIGELPSTVADRSIIIRLERRLPTEEVKKLRQREVEELSLPLRLRIANWSISNRGRLIGARPRVPEELNDRAADVMETLLSIADLAGVAWRRRAREAAVKLFAPEDTEDEESVLFMAIQQTFEEFGEDRISSVQLCTMLSQDVAIVKMDPRKLAEKLRGFMIRPRAVRLPDGRVAKGYKKEDFERSFERYVA